MSNLKLRVLAATLPRCSIDGFIRTPLSPRYEVRREPFTTAHYKDNEEAEQARKFINEWKVDSGPAKLVTIQRNALKRTVVNEEKTLTATYYAIHGGKKVLAIVRRESPPETWDVALSVASFEVLTPELRSLKYPSREEAELVVCGWLHENGFKVKR